MRHSLAAAVLSCAAYSACSVSMVLLNKHLLTGWGFEFPVLLLAAQNVVGASATTLAGLCGVVEVQRVTKQSALETLPLNVFFTLMLFTSFHSLALLAVPMITVFKNLTNILIVAGDASWFGQRVSPLVVASLAVTLAGAVMAAKHDLAFSAAGYSWMSLNCVSTAGYVLYMRKVSSVSQLSRFGLALHNNVLSLPLLLAVAAAQGELAGVAGAPALREPAFVALVVVSGLTGFGLSLASFWCVSETSATTYAVVGSLNKVPLTVLGFLLFAVPVSAGGVFFVSVSILGGMLYSYAKLRERAEAAEGARGKDGV